MDKNLDKLIQDMKDEMNKRDLSDSYLAEHNQPTREDIGIGEYAYGITMIPCDVVYPYLVKLQDIYKTQNKIKNNKPCTFNTPKGEYKTLNTAFYL